MEVCLANGTLWIVDRVRRHNEIRDSLGDTCRLAYSDVSKEPVVRDANESVGVI